MSEKSPQERYLMVCVISGKELLDLLLEAYLEIGISGATVVQSQGMGHILSRDFPLFAGFKELLEAGGSFNYTVMSVVENLSLVDEIRAMIPSLRSGEHPRGILFTVPVSQFYKFGPETRA